MYKLLGTWQVTMTAVAFMAGGLSRVEWRTMELQEGRSSLWQ